jgi:addiction module HigA family antidote
LKSAESSTTDGILALHGTVVNALHVPPNLVYQILNGKRAMRADTALRLGQWLGTSAELWMNLQKMYELRLAEQQAGEEIRRVVKRWNPSTVAAASAR